MSSLKSLLTQAAAVESRNHLRGFTDAPKYVLTHLGQGVPAVPQWSTEEYFEFLKTNVVFENEQYIAFNKPCQSNMLRMRADISISNPKWRRRLADYLGIKNQLLVAKNAPNYMSGILLLAKDASLVEDFNDRSRREIIGFRRRPYEIELILVGHSPGAFPSESEEPVKFWTRIARINDVTQNVFAYRTSKSEIRSGSVKMSAGSLAVKRSAGGNCVNAILRLDHMAHGIVSLFALKYKWAILGDHLYAHRLSYLDDSIKLVDPLKCPVDKPQQLTKEVREALELPLETVHQLPLFAHFSKLSLPAFKKHSKLTIECPLPSYFDAAKQKLFYS